MTDSDIITVCDKCFTACCWHGDFMCDEARYAGTVEKSVGELRKLGLEHPSHWRVQLFEKEVKNGD